MTTITRDKLLQIARDNTGPGEIMPDIGWLETVVTLAGITIAPPDPPEAMVKLAREIAADATYADRDKYDADVASALAALQHAVEVVKGAPVVKWETFEPKPQDGLIYRNAILTALGAGGERD